jgi:hypothetical protein
MREGRPDSQRARAVANGPQPDRFWPLVALVATIVATAGWTTVVVMAITDQDPVAAASPSTPGIAEGTEELPIDEPSPLPLTHDAPEVEALLPATWQGTPMSVESSTGEVVLIEDAWSQVFRTFLEDSKKTPADLLVARSYEPTGTLQMSVSAFKIDGIAGDKVLETVIGAWKAEDEDLVVSTVTLGGKSVTRGVFASTDVNSYWYEHEGVVYDVETSDEALAGAVIATLP